MNHDLHFHIPNCEEFRRGYEAYNQREIKGPIYFEAMSIISDQWGNPTGMAEGVSRLVRGWNYLYANFNFTDLVNCVENNLTILDQFRNRDISSLSNKDSDTIRRLFDEFLEALKREVDNRKSPVSVAKALNPLAPYFFPIWDSNIAFAYDCLYWADFAAPPYITFSQKMKLMSEKVCHCVPKADDRSLLKRIDEYNYSKFTMGWI